MISLPLKLNNFLKKKISVNSGGPVADNTNIIFKAIIKTERTEKIMDALEQRYSHMDHFRMVLLPLEASFPSSKEIEDNGKTVETDQAAVEEEKPPLRVSSTGIVQ